MRAKAIEALCRCVGVDDENADIVVSPKQIRLEALSVIYKLFHDLFMSLKTKTKSIIEFRCEVTDDNEQVASRCCRCCCRWQVHHCASSTFVRMHLATMALPLSLVLCRYFSIRIIYRSIVLFMKNVLFVKGKWSTATIGDR